MTPTNATKTLTMTPRSPAMKRTLLLTVLLAAGGAGCAEEMDPPSLIERTRVLGAQLEVEGKPGQSMPRPGEKVTVSWLMTAPDELPAVGWAFALCRAQNAQALSCRGEPLTVFQGQDVPRFTVTVPPLDQLAGAGALVLFGQICTASEPIMDETTGRPGCTRDGDGTTASVAIPVQLGDDGNANPGAPGPLWFDGGTWASEQECGGLPKVVAGTKAHRLRFETSGSDRERYQALVGDPPALRDLRERLQVSQFTTAGEFNRSFSSIEADDGSERPVTELEWDAPLAADVPDEGMVVRFTFVARDLRGGVSTTTRALCVTR